MFYMFQTFNIGPLNEKMPLLDISGVSVNFPFELYPCQVTYMEKYLKVFMFYMFQTLNIGPLNEKMPLLDISGVSVNFPFEPYPCQVTYMEKLIKCLKEVYVLEIFKCEMYISSRWPDLVI